MTPSLQPHAANIDPPPKKSAQDSVRQWELLSAAIIAVLGVTLVAVLIVVAAVTAYEMGELARTEETRKASNLAHFMARTAFVPVSLGDIPTLERAVNVYLDDPDVVGIAVFDADGHSLLAREVRLPPGPRRLVEASQPILPPQEGWRGPAPAKPLGLVKVSVSLARVDGAVKRSILWIAAVCVLLFAISFVTDRALISQMTRRLKNLLEELEARKLELQRSNDDLEQFAYVASHDLQEPLRMIASYVELLGRRYKGRLDRDADEFIAYAIDGATRMQEMISGLLAYARVDKKLVFRTTDVSAPLNDALANLKMAVQESGAIVRCSAMPRLNADSLQLVHLFQNLIGNAIKYRGSDRLEIDVEAVDRGEAWLFCVKDNGIGIAPQYFNQLFGLFHRLHARADYPGMGIGLAICRKIAESHGGRIWVESIPGKGSTFYFTIAKELKVASEEGKSDL